MIVTMPLLVNVVLFIVIATVVYVWRWRSSRLWVMGERIAGPRALPLVGNVAEFWGARNGRDLLQRIVAIVERYPRLTRLWLGNTLVLCSTDPRHFEPLLSNENEKSDQYTFMKPWLGNGLVTAPAAAWATSRRLLNPSFHSRILDNFVDIFCKNALILVDKLEKKVGGQEFDISKYIALCTMDNITETAMGCALHAQDHSTGAVVQAMMEQQELIIKRVFRPWLYSDVTFKLSSTGKRQAAVLRVIGDFVQDIIQTRKKQRETTRSNSEQTPDDKDTGQRQHTAFLDLLLNGTQLSDRQILDEVATFVFAGQDTTTTLLSFLCFCLACHQDVQERVIAEQTQIFGNSERLPTPADLNQMKYLEQVIRETMRLYPPVPIFGRKLQRDVVIGNNTIPAGANVLIITFCTQRSEQYYPHPLTFDPDRFLPENVSKREPLQYVAFGAGRRNCIGQRYAMMQAKTVTSILIRRYRLLPPQNTDIFNQLSFMITLKCEDGPRVRIIRRLS